MRKKKTRAPPKNRTRYEGELVKIVGTMRPDCYVSPSGNTQVCVQKDYTWTY
jgi:hypothetical protein